MYTVSQAVKDAIMSNDRIVDAKIEINGVPYGTDNIQSFTFEDISNVETFLMVGSVAAAKVDVSLLDVSGVNLESAEFKVYAGIEVSGSMTYIPLGVFYADADSIKRKKNNVSLTLYDGMMKAQREYVSSLSYPANINAVMNEVASTMGVQFVGALPNYTIPTKPDGYSCRGIIGLIAQLCGGFAKFTRDGKLTIKNYTSVSFTIDGGSYIGDAEKKRESLYKINKVVGIVPTDEESDAIEYSAGVGNVVMTIENPYITQAIVNDIYNRYKNFEYIPLFLETQGNPLLDTGDIITVETVEEESLMMPIMRHTLSFAGGYIGQIESMGETESAVFNLAGSIGERLDVLEENMWKYVLVNITSTSGMVFKNGIGSTELTAKTFLNGIEVDVAGTRYEYRWNKFDKNGNLVVGATQYTKSITVNANAIDEKVTYKLEVILNGEVLSLQEITLTNVYDGETGPQGPKGADGKDGKTYYTWIKYADSPTSGMSDNPSGKEYIGIAYNKESPTPSTNYADYVWSKFKGDDGVPGPPGADGQTTYTWIKYADDQNGNGMSDSPDGKLYIGLAFNKTTPTESSNPNDYQWSLMPQNIEVGGRNLLRNSKNSGNAAPTQYQVDRFYLTEQLIEGQKYTLRMLLNTSVEKKAAAAFVGGGMIVIKWFHNISPGESIYTVTFTATAEMANITQSAQSRYINIYVSNNNGTQNSTPVTGTANVVWIKLEKGDKATDWDAAPEDTQAQIDEAQQTADNAQSTANNALTQANTANSKADTALTSANSKNTVFHQATTPSTTNRKIGDTWFKSDEGNALYIWDGSQWVKRPLDYQALAVGQLSAISADLGNVTAGHIQGVTLNLANGKVVVDLNGNAVFKGTIEGASGRFGEVTVNEGDITIKDANSNVKALLTPLQNLLGDPGFEGVLYGPEDMTYNWADFINPSYAQYDTWIHRAYWTKVGNPKVAKVADLGSRDPRYTPIFGDLAVVVNNANYVRQFIGEGIGPNGVYTLSVFCKRQYNTTAGALKLQINRYRSGTFQSAIKTETFATVPSDYTVVRFATTFTLPSNFNPENGDYIEIVIAGANNNRIQCDGAQLVQSLLPTVYNPDYDSLKATEWGNQATIWTGALYPLNTHTITPKIPLSQCNFGWLLKWEAYNQGSGTTNADFQYSFVPNTHIYNLGTGMDFTLNRYGTPVFKYLYITDTTIKGHANNNANNNHLLVLTEVLAV